ncbi:hypothetical protein V3C40_27665 [Janthinobacterium sp. LS2A]|uniref:hypothetical protein n=1 Tax=Janthinobacterium sp. LS2A TaxID=3118590 RepID=UPI002F93D198
MTMNTYRLSRHGMLILATVAMQAAWAEAEPDAAIYTLYRNSVTDAALRLHVATFDALDGAAYNRQNCAQARQLFAVQEGVRVAFWCEPGRFRAIAASDHVPDPGQQFITGKPAERNCSPSASELARGDKRPASAGNGCSP